jgi:O-antigen/teichoic acid export membrane protein
MSALVRERAHGPNRLQVPRRRVVVRFSRPAIGVADQCVYSVTNFATTLLAARIVAPGRLGALVLALSVAYMVTILARGVTGEPIMTLCPRLKGAELRHAERDAVATALLLGGFLAVAIAAVALAATNITQDFAWVAICIPAVLVQDALRYVGFARRRPDTALLSDITWMVVQFGLLAFFFGAHTATVHWILLCWGAGAFAGAVVGAIALSVPPSGSPRRWHRTSSSYSRWLVPQLGLSQVTDQTNGLVVVTIFGSAALGGFRAMQTFVRPAFIFMLAMQALLVPGLTRQLVSHGGQGLMKQARRLAIWIGLIALAAVIPVVIAARPLSREVLGPSYVRYSSLLLPFAVASVFHACAVLPNAGLRALQCGKRILLVQVVASGVTLICVLCAALFSTVYVTTWAMASLGLVSATIAWIALATAEGVRTPAKPPATVADAEQDPYRDSPDVILSRLERHVLRRGDSTDTTADSDLTSRANESSDVVIRSEVLG